MVLLGWVLFGRVFLLITLPRVVYSEGLSSSGGPFMGEFSSTTPGVGSSEGESSYGRPLDRPPWEGPFWDGVLYYNPGGGF